MKNHIVIVGAGSAGLSFARSLADTDIQITIIEQSNDKALAYPQIDGRDIALTHFSKALLQRLGIWARFPDNAISQIKQAKVIDGDSPYVLGFDHNAKHDDCLGFMIANHHIRKALYDEVRECANVKLMTNNSVESVRTDSTGACVTLNNGKTLDASLIVAADSRFSTTRRYMGISASMQDFGRVAIVCRMHHEHVNPGIAFECFHYARTLAVLPISKHESSIVITIKTDQSGDVCTMDEAQFSLDIQQRFGEKLGEMKLVGKRYPYPLVAVWANQFIANRFALIGDAAVGMHPVTAHGFNLGLKSQDTLSGLIKQAALQNKNIASDKLLKQYQAKHRRTARPVYMGTNAIVKLYTNDYPLPNLVRKAVLRFSNHFPPIKHAIVNQLTGRG
jgi:ubiquinone biosynthesis UbiH/UbiF/VisC/COQ6 family hydroxylase